MQKLNEKTSMALICRTTGSKWDKLLTKGGNRLKKYALFFSLFIMIIVFSNFVKSELLEDVDIIEILNEKFKNSQSSYSNLYVEEILGRELINESSIFL
jgi:hypothetical protein